MPAHPAAHPTHTPDPGNPPNPHLNLHPSLHSDRNRQVYLVAALVSLVGVGGEASLVALQDMECLIAMFALGQARVEVDGEPQACPDPDLSPTDPNLNANPNGGEPTGAHGRQTLPEHTAGHLCPLG